MCLVQRVRRDSASGSGTAWLDQQARRDSTYGRRSPPACPAGLTLRGVGLRGWTIWPGGTGARGPRTSARAWTGARVPCDRRGACRPFPTPRGLRSVGGGGGFDGIGVETVVGVEARSGPDAPARPPARPPAGDSVEILSRASHPAAAAREPKVFFPSSPTAAAVAPWRPGAPRRTWCAGTGSALRPGGESSWPPVDPAPSR